MVSRSVRPLLFACMAALAASPSLPHARADDDLPKQAGIDNGLCVLIGITDAGQVTAFTNSGKMLVQALALDAPSRDAARQALTRDGLYGLATVDLLPAARLPYADNLVNLLVVDRDACGARAPAEAEALRVLAPYGVLCQRAGGKFTYIRKPRPATYDDWGHFDYAADGNSVSRDTAVSQPHHLQWTSGMQWIQPSGNPAGYDTPAGVRISGRYAVLDWTHDIIRAADKNQKAYLQCRDAFSGIPLWTIERSPTVGKRRWTLVASGDYVYTYLKADGDIAALNIATGQTVRTFPSTAALKPGERGGLPEERIWIRVHGDTLLVNLGDTLKCFDTQTAALRWSFTQEGQDVLIPTLDHRTQRVYISTAASGTKFASRWPWAKTNSVIALDLKTGKKIWQCDGVAGKPIGQLVPAGDYVVAFGSAAIGGGDKGFIGSIRATGADAGKLLSETSFQGLREYNIAMYNALYRDGLIYFAGAFSNIWSYNPQTGEMIKVWTTSYNQRCTRFNATDNLFIWGYVSYLDKNFTGTLQSVTRSGCAIGSIPANGMMYFTPSACGCFTQTRGYQAYSPEPLLPPLPEEGRLLRGTGKPGPLITSDSKLPAGLIAEDWPRQVRTQILETEPTLSGGLRYLAVIHQHRIECRDDAGKVRWTFIAGGRVTQSPLIKDGIAFFGSHDGRVYALEAATGELRWSYLLAPNLRQVTAFGQLVNTWPVYGVCEFEGAIVASAGTHPEIGGGVAVAGLEPASGKPRWKKILSKPPATLEVVNGKTRTTIIPRSFLNDIPAVEEGKIVLRASTTGGSFAFSPSETEAELNTRLNTPPPKKVPVKTPPATQTQPPANAVKP